MYKDKKLYTLIVYFLILNTASGQSFEKEKIIKDLLFFAKAIEEAHPSPLKSNAISKTYQNIEALKTLDNEVLNKNEWLNPFKEIIYELGCVHTRLVHVPSDALTKKQYFPLYVKLIGEDLFVLKDSLHESVGSKIISINNKKTNDLIDNIKYMYASDGGTDVLSKAVFNMHSPLIISNFFQYPDEYKVVLQGNDTLTCKAISDIWLADKRIIKASKALSNGENHLYQYRDLWVLKVAHFTPSDRRFFKSAVEYLLEEDAYQLVIDLRGNTGGNRKAAVALAKCLLQIPFQYELQQDKNLKPKEFLDKKGKRAYLLSRVKYNVFHCARGKKTEYGRAFIYRYKPNKHSYTEELFVLSNGYTASSATMLSSWLKQHRDIKIMGSQAAGGYNGNNGGGFPSLTLPHTGIRVVFPVYRLVFDAESEQIKGLEPDLPIFYQIEDYLQNYDLELEILTRIIRR